MESLGIPGPPDDIVGGVRKQSSSKGVAKLMRDSRLFPLILSLLATAGTASLAALGDPAPGTSTADAKPFATRVVAYQIDARLDPTKKTVDATETLTYQ